MVGRAEDGRLAGLFDADVTDEVIRHAHCEVHVVRIGVQHDEYDRTKMIAS